MPISAPRFHSLELVAMHCSFRAKLDPFARLARGRFVAFLARGAGDHVVVRMLSAPNRREMSLLVLSKSFTNSSIFGFIRTVGTVIVTQ